jgi:hypothetical protein
MFRIKRFLLISAKVTTLVFLISAGCGKDDQPYIDTGFINIFIYPNSTQYLQLNTIGGWVYLTSNPPSRGVLVYRLSLDEFKAYERTPTYKPDSCCTYDPVVKCPKIVMNESGLIAVDTCSGSEWLILDGSVTKGPATYPLVEFHTMYDGEVLHIYN